MDCDEIATPSFTHFRSGQLAEIGKCSYADSSKSKSQSSDSVTLPEKPKHPYGSFLRFLQDVQPKLRAESPDVPQKGDY